MLLSEILMEMPVKAPGTLGAKFTSYNLPYADLDNFFVIETDINVSLLLDDDESPKTILFAMIDDDDMTVQVLGRLFTSSGLFSKLTPPKTIIEHIITIDDRWKGRGIGVNVYKALLKEGFSILSDGVHFEDAFWFWKKLIRLAPKWGIKVYLIKDTDFLRDKTGSPKIINTRTDERLIWDLSTDRILLTQRTVH